MFPTQNLHVRETVRLLTPRALKAELPMSEASNRTVVASRRRVGARPTEAQTHGELASGLSMPVGCKNGTDGSLQIAVDAMQSARAAHSFLGIDQDGITSIIRTTGNPAGHVVLRGGRLRTNYDAESLQEAEASLTQAGVPAVLMVDCSHANSGKQHARQEQV